MAKSRKSRARAALAAEYLAEHRSVTASDPLPTTTSFPAPDAGDKGRRRPLNGPEAVVIVVVIIAAVVLGLAHVTVGVVIALLAAAGAVSVAVVNRRVPRVVIPQSN
ncbi:hypothetical protein [Streptomyces sp. H39-S7]|uniref:hypothetical protein n=1 Tax=Streptomyces sp. H39-S7 TaxID=3004357 RepID=UPI0022AEACE4|nr:hypothetical protein [Streptomyces sp. H39-S7]MCZ4122775.1 hypothetical protein [Streptomyces sp. H39-S7]